MAQITSVALYDETVFEKKRRYSIKVIVLLLVTIRIANLKYDQNTSFQ